VEEKQAEVMAMQQQQMMEAAVAPRGFERASMPVPPQPQGTVDTQNFWDNFGNVADRDPANAWRYLSMAQQNPSVFRQKLLVMD